MEISISENRLAYLRNAFNFEREGCITMQNKISEDYQQILLKNFKGFMVALSKKDEDQYDSLNMKFHSLEDNEIKLFLQIPEISHQILSYNPSVLIKTASFLHRSIDAEISRKTSKYDIQKHDHLWTADGSFYIKHDGAKFAFFNTFYLLKKIPVDFISPYNLRITNKELNEKPEHKIHLYELDAIEVLCDKLDSAVEPIANFPTLINQLTRYIRTIIINRITLLGEPVYYCSGSDAKYICRAIISNIANAKQEAIIESLIHESIHSTLYMANLSYQWLPDSNIISTINYTVKSPWTGNHISIANVLEAIFVWYGVYKFWKIAKLNNLYNHDITIKRLNFLKNGFESLDLNTMMDSYGIQLEKDLNELILSLKYEVLNDDYKAV